MLERYPVAPGDASGLFQNVLQTAAQAHPPDEQLLLRSATGPAVGKLAVAAGMVVVVETGDSVAFPAAASSALAFDRSSSIPVDRLFAAHLVLCLDSSTFDCSAVVAVVAAHIFVAAVAAVVAVLVVAVGTAAVTSVLVESMTHGAVDIAHG